MMVDRRPLVFGHRGASDEAPENTLKAFQLAMEQGADGIETDLHITRDGIIVCVHDADLQRMAGRPEKIGDLTYDELYELIQTSPAYAGELIPKLADLLAWRAKTCLLMLELKDECFQQTVWAEQLVDLLHRYEAFSGLWISSFDVRCLKATHEVMPTVPLIWISKLLIPIEALWMEGYSPHYTVIEQNPVLCRSYRALGKMISVWDPHPEERVAFHLDQGVDAVTANRPGRFMAAVQDYKNKYSG